VVKFTSFRG
jgi:hypothetical protein